MRKVFLDDIPKWERGTGSGRGVEGTIKWKDSVGLTFEFIYDDIKGTIKIIGYNPNNRNVILQYKEQKPFEMTAASVRKCNLGGILMNETKFKYNEENRRRVDLRKLARSNNGGIKWAESIGKNFYFSYDDIEGYIKILKYQTKGQTLTLQFKDKTLDIKTSDLLRCKIGSLIGKWYTDFQYSIGDIINTNYCTLELTERFKRYDKAHKGIMKWYKYKCCDCGWSDGEIRENDLQRGHRGSCPKCGDGNSYPNKIGFNLLEQLNISFEQEYNPEWIAPKRYDFYFELNKNKYIIEMDGGFHKKNNGMSGQTKEESKNIDDYKDKIADEHDIEVIRIDCEVSSSEYIKPNLFLSHLSDLFNLDLIDWLECEEYSCRNLMKEVCKLRSDTPNLTTRKISENTGIGKRSVIRYLKRGNNLGWCDYDSKKESIRIAKMLKGNGKKVEIFKENISLGKFESCSDLARKSIKLFKIKLANNSIAAVCRGNFKTSKGFAFKYI